jgi:hypothetical protein
MKELCLPPGNLGRRCHRPKHGSAPTRQSAAEAGQAWAEPTSHEHPSRPPAAVPAKPGAGGAITTLAARRLPRPAGLPAAYQTRSSLPRSGCLTSDTVVNPPVPNSSWVPILTDSVWVPAANVTVSWPSTSGST